jgi:lipid-binding SYLF domain-containing protein
VFAGIALQGATLRPDEDTDRDLYGHAIDRAAALNGQIPTPPAAAELIKTLTRYSGTAK